MNCEFDLGDMNLGQGHDTPLGHGKPLYEILSRSNMTKWSYGPDTILAQIMDFFLIFSMNTAGKNQNLSQNFKLLLS